MSIENPGSDYGKALCTPFKKSDYKYSNQRIFDDLDFSRKIKAVHDETDSTFKKNTPATFQSGLKLSLSLLICQMLKGRTMRYIYFL